MITAIPVDSIVDQLTEGVAITAGARRYFDALAMHALTHTDPGYAGLAGQAQTTVLSRFARAGLRTPKQYHQSFRLCYAAWLLDQADLTIAAVAYHLRYASPQSFGRHLRFVLGLTGTQFRDQMPYPVMLQGVRGALFTDYAGTLTWFDPYAFSSNRPGRRARRQAAVAS